MSQRLRYTKYELTAKIHNDKQTAKIRKDMSIPSPPPPGPLPSPRTLATRNYDPSNPSQWNPYSIAMQAAEQNRTRNTDFIHGNNKEGAGVGGASAGESHENDEDRGGGFGAWFRGFGGGGQEGAAGAENGGVYGGSEAGAAAAGRGRGWWGNGGGAGEGNGGAAGVAARAGSPVETQVKALVEMGFAEVQETAGLCCCGVGKV